MHPTIPALILGAFAAGLSTGAQRTPSSSEPPSTFTRASVTHGSSREPARLSFGDFDGDGLLDALAIGAEGKLRLLRNLGDGAFDDVSVFAGLSEVLGASLVLWEDYDRDGKLDLFVGTACGPRHLFHNEGAGAFGDVAQSSGLRGEGCDEHLAEWMDYDRDGRLDLHLEGASGGRLYHALADGRFEEHVLSVAPGTLDTQPEVLVRDASDPSSAKDSDKVREAGSRSSEDAGGRVVDPRASSAAGSPGSRRVPIDISLVGLPTSGGTQPLQVFPACATSIKDQANPGTCLKATSVPTPGMLFPPPHDGGVNNVASGANSFIGGGQDNQATNGGGYYGALGHTTVGGGRLNIASGNYATVGGGGGYHQSFLFPHYNVNYGNTASGTASTVGGGQQNSASGSHSTVGGGGGFQEGSAGYDTYGNYGNTASGNSSTVGGGQENSASGSHATIGGGQNNTATGDFATVGGGGVGNYNSGTSARSGNTAAVGFANAASSRGSTVGGGQANTASGNHATVGGGGGVFRSKNGDLFFFGNTASGEGATVGGGKLNQASGSSATIGGGRENTASDFAAMVGGGIGNTASGYYATVGGGSHNTASGYNAAVGGGGGYYGRNTASGSSATVPGGSANTAMGDYSFAAGRRAKANHTGAFVWGDSQDVDKTSSAADEFNVYAEGGARIFAAGTSSPSLVIDSAGNVGIGTATPSEAFHVAGNALVSGSLSSTTVSVENSGADWMGFTDGGVTEWDIAGNAASWDLNETNVTSRIHVDAGGKVGIGTTAPGFLLEVNGSAGKPGGGAWSHSSDERLKKNIHDLEGSLETLLALRGVSFEYKDPAAIHELPGQRIGFIAQEVEQVLPDWVEEGANGYKRLTVRGFEALAVEALREIHAANQELREANSALEERVQRLESLEAELEALRTALSHPQH